jgi:hypothetical protein
VNYAGEYLERASFERKIDESMPFVWLTFRPDDEKRYRVKQAYQLRVPFMDGVIVDFYV